MNNTLRLAGSEVDFCGCARFTQVGTQTLAYDDMNGQTRA